MLKNCRIGQIVLDGRETHGAPCMRACVCLFVVVMGQRTFKFHPVNLTDYKFDKVVNLKITLNKTTSIVVMIVIVVVVVSADDAADAATCSV